MGTDLRDRTFRSLRVRNYRLFFAGHAVSVSGTWMQRVGQDWLVLTISDSAVALGITTALQFLPMLLLGMYGGLLADRHDKRRLIIATQAAQAALALALGVLAVTGSVRLWMVYLLALLLGLVTVVDVPARQAFVAELVRGDDIMNAQSLNSTVHNVGRLVGPALAGLLIAGVGVASTFFVNAASFAAVLLALTRIDPGQLHRPPPVAPAPRQIRDGLHYVWTRHELRASMALVAVVALFGQNFRVVLPLLARDTFGGDAATYGYLTAMLGLGAVVGALLSAGRATATATALVVSCFSFGVASLLVAAAPSLWLALAAMVAVGVANISFNTTARTLLQINSERAMHGRVMALHGLVFLGSTPVGGPLLGWVSERWGPRAGLAVGGVTALAAAGGVLPVVLRLRGRAPAAELEPAQSSR